VVGATIHPWAMGLAGVEGVLVRKSTRSKMLDERSSGSFKAETTTSAEMPIYLDCCAMLNLDPERPALKDGAPSCTPASPSSCQGLKKE